MTIGERIKKIRMARGISTYTLSQVIGLSQSSVSKIENGHRRLLAEEAMQIANALKVDITEIFAG